MVVMPDNMSVERRELLQLYGAAVILSEGAKGTNGAIELANRMAQDKRYYMPYQFGNPANPLAHYETTGVEILEDMGDIRIDVFIAGIGTGGTLMGVGRRLKEHNPNVKIIGVEPFPGDPIPGLRSLQEGFVPPIIDLSLIDQRTLVSSKVAIAAARDLLQREGIFAGPSSGAALHQAVKTAREMGSGNIVVILPDGGWKYLSMDVWSRKDGL